MAVTHEQLRLYDGDHYQLKRATELLASCNLFVGDALTQLKGIEDQNYHCCITSPPYWGLRDYGIPNQIGSEETLSAYLEHLVRVFREVRRVLRDDGTL